MKRQRPSGFTLVELLVALGLFGLIAGAGVVMLNVAVNTRSASQQQLAAQGALLRSRALLEADLGQAAPRRWRDEAGAPQPAFASDAASGLLLRLVRRGWENPDGAPRASLQRVEWRLEQGRLERRAAGFVDGARTGPPAGLIEGVRSARMRFFIGGRWQDSWPGPGQPVIETRLPVAVELVLDLAGTGAVRQLFLLPPDDRA